MRYVHMVFKVNSEGKNIIHSVFSSQVKADDFVSNNEPPRGYSWYRISRIVK